MKKRILLLALLAVIGFLLIVHWTSPQINRLTFDRIQIGMSESDLVALLNCRPGKYTTDSIASLIDGPNLSLHSRRRSWIGDGGAIVVTFDADGEVDGKSFLEARGDGGFLARVRQWFESFRGPPPDSGSVISTNW